MQKCATIQYKKIHCSINNNIVAWLNSLEGGRWCCESFYYSHNAFCLLPYVLLRACCPLPLRKRGCHGIASVTAAGSHAHRTYFRSPFAEFSRFGATSVSLMGEQQLHVSAVLMKNYVALKACCLYACRSRKRVALLSATSVAESRKGEMFLGGFAWIKAGQRGSGRCWAAEARGA